MAIAYGYYSEHQRRQSDPAAAMTESVFGMECHPSNRFREASPGKAEDLLAEVEEWLKQQQ